jgi:NDP-sugar pyrophosphorylase family protein
MNSSSIPLEKYLSSFALTFPELSELEPWQVTGRLSSILEAMIARLPGEEYIVNGNVATHRTVVVEGGAVLKGPLIISRGGFVGAHSYLRSGVFIGAGSVIGPGCEIKTSIIMENCGLAHFNFVGDSLLGSNVNMEAGSVIANHYNERVDKTIRIATTAGTIRIPSVKFGALVGDHAKIGANAVLSPGTVLEARSVVGRLTLVSQVTESS